MKTVQTVAPAGLIVLFIWAAATQTQEKETAGKGLDPETIAAYEKLGATFGAMEVDTFGGFEFVAGVKNAKRNLPAFRFTRKWQGKLPVVTVPFALVLQDFGVADAELKQVAGFKELQMLHLGESEYLGDARRPIKVTDAAVKGLAGLKQLRSLDVSYTKTTDSGLKELAGLKNLETLTLFDTQITDAGLKALAAMKNLKYLNLGYTKVSNVGLKELLGLQKLQSLSLSNTKVTGEGLKQLAGLKQLVDLDLHFVIPVSNANLKELAGLKYLRKLYLDSCSGVTDAGTRELQKALPSVTIYLRK